MRRKTDAGIDVANGDRYGPVMPKPPPKHEPLSIIERRLLDLIHRGVGTASGISRSTSRSNAEERAAAIQRLRSLGLVEMEDRREIVTRTKVGRPRGTTWFVATKAGDVVARRLRAESEAIQRRV